MKSKRNWAIAGATLVALLAVGWGWLFGWGDSPELASLQRDFDAAIATGGAPPPREEMRPRIDALSESQRRRFFARNRETMMSAVANRMVATLNLPPAERRREIAGYADRLAAARASGETDRAGFPGPPGGGPPGGGPGGGRRGPPEGMSQSERMKRVASFTTPEMRGAFSETKRLIDDELASRGQDPITPREMRFVTRPPRG